MKRMRERYIAWIKAPHRDADEAVDAVNTLVGPLGVAVAALVALVWRRSRRSTAAADADGSAHDAMPVSESAGDARQFRADLFAKGQKPREKAGD